jgi:hypothetical protein
MVTVPYTGEEPSILCVRVGGVYVDPLRVVLPLTHTYGRSDPGVQPEPPAVSFDWLGPLSFSYGTTSIELTTGMPVILEYDQASGGLWSDTWDDHWSDAWDVGTLVVPRRRVFTGRITDLSAQADAVSLQTSVTAIGTTAEVAIFPFTPSLGAATEAARVTTIAAALPFTVVNDAGTLNLLARVAETAPALDLLHELAGMTGSFVWEDENGAVRYQGPLNRPSGVEVPLAMTDILAPVGWAQRSGNVYNSITVTYGPDVTSPAERDSVIVESAPMIAKFGRRSLPLDTRLATEADASMLGAIVLGHWADPFWDAPQLLVDFAGIADALWAQLIDVNVNDVLLADGVTATPNTPAGTGAWLVEGWVMTVDRDDAGRLHHSRQYGVSDVARWGNIRLATTTTATANDLSVKVGETVLLTVNVKDENAAFVASGGVEVWDGTTLVSSATITSAGAFIMACVMPLAGTRTLNVRYSGGPTLEPSSGNVTGIVVTALVKTTRTLTYSATDAATYDPTNKSGATPNAYQAGPPGSLALRSLVLFPSISAAWAGWTITKVEVEVTVLSVGSSPGTIVLGSAGGSTLPASWPGSAVEDRQRESITAGAHWLTLDGWGETTFPTGTRVLVIGSGITSSLTYVVIVTGSGANVPRLRVTGYQYA